MYCECGNAIKIVSLNPACQAKVTELFPLNELAAVAHTSDAVRRIHATDTIAALLSNQFCVLKMLERDHFPAIATLANSPYTHVAASAREVLQSLFQGGMFVKHFKAERDIITLVGLAVNPNPSLQASVLHALALITATAGPDAILSHKADVTKTLLRVATARGPGDIGGFTEALPTAREDAIKTIQLIAQRADAGKVHVVRAGFIFAIPHLLSDEDNNVAATALRILALIVDTPDFRYSVIDQGLPAAVQVARLHLRREASRVVTEAAVDLLYQLAGDRSVHPALADHDVVPLLMAYATSGKFDESVAVKAVDSMILLAQNPLTHAWFERAECVEEILMTMPVVNDDVDQAPNKAVGVSVGVRRRMSVVKAEELVEILDSSKEIRRRRRTDGLFCGL